MASRFCVFWIRKTIRNVTIVVPVLITSCHVSEKSKIGPEIRPHQHDRDGDDERPVRTHHRAGRLGEAWNRCRRDLPPPLSPATDGVLRGGEAALFVGLILRG